MRRIFAFVAVGFLVLSALAFVGPRDTAVGRMNAGTAPNYVTHAPIRIDSNADFAIGINGISAGDGSVGNPWLIQGWDINGSIVGDGIYVGNTTDHFVIDGCHLHDANNTQGVNYWTNSGLHLYNVTNGTLRNSICDDNMNYAAYIEYSEYITLGNNQIESLATAESYCGSLWINQCLHLTLTGNGIIGHAIELWGWPEEYWTTHTMDATNLVNGRPLQYWVGVNGGTVPANAGQVILAGCLSVTVQGQSFDMPGNGIIAGFCVMSGFHNNTFGGTSELNIWQGGGNVISDNEFTGAKLYLRASDSNLVRDNQFRDCIDSAIQIDDATNNLVTRNSISNTSTDYAWGSAVFILYSDETSIYENVLENNHRGVWLYESCNVSITQNTFIGDGVQIEGNDLVDWTTHVIDDTNTVNGKPIAYCRNQTGWSAPAGCGQVIAANCVNISIANQNLGDADVGVQLFKCMNVTVSNVEACEGVTGLSASQCTRLDVRGGRFDNNSGYGMHVSHSDDVRINGTCASFNDEGIHVWECEDVFIRGMNTSNNSDSGIYLGSLVNFGDPPCNVSISDCLVVGNSFGIELYNCNDSRITNNTANHNYYGIRLYESSNNTISGNTLNENQLGLYLIYASNNNTIIDNLLYHNNRAIQLQTFLHDNRIYHNEFIINVQPVYDEYDGFNKWDNGYPSGGNYWSDYNGTDVMSGLNQNIPGSDGLGDVPYWNILDHIGNAIPRGNITDDYPIMTPSVDLEPSVSNAICDGAYWHNSPAVVKANCSDEHNTVSEVSLWYSYGPTNGTYPIEINPPWWEGWSNWTYFDIDGSASWEWEFDFPSGEGNYQFSTLSVDSEGNNETLTKTYLYMEAGLAYDITPPIINLTSHTNNSLVNPGDDIEFSARDPGNGSGVANFTWTMNSDEATGWYGYIDTTYWSDRHYFINTTATDLAGNVEFRSFEFDVDTSIPTVASVSPENDAAEVPLDSTITIEFSEPMNITSVQWALTFSPDIGTPTFAWNLGDDTLTVIPPSPLTLNTTYQCSVSIGAKDLANNSMASDYRWHFHTPWDTDGDGILDVDDPDDDNDGVPDEEDAFPLDSSETVDTDGDGIGDNADTDDDGDGVDDSEDAFPLDPDEWLDTDADGMGNNADPDDDNDGVPDEEDPDPLDPEITGKGTFWATWWVAIVILAAVAAAVAALVGLAAYQVRKIPSVPEEDARPADEGKAPPEGS